MTISTSIVIPAYNGERYLGETIASVRALDCDDWELLVIDDGSTDATPEIAQHWAKQDKRIQYFRRDTPSGSACPARNDGYRRSNPKSQYLLFLDQDDLLKPNALSQLRQRLEEDPDAVAVHGLVEYLDAEGNVSGQQDPLGRYELRGKRIPSLALDEMTTFDTLATVCCIETPGCVLIRRNALGEDLPFPEDKLALDWDGWLMLTRQQPMVPLFEVVLSYRKAAEGMSRNQKKLRDRSLATRRRIAADSLFTPQQREYILRASGSAEHVQALEKVRYLRTALRKGKVVEALRQGVFGWRHWQRGLKNSLDARRWIQELREKEQTGP